MEATSNMAVFNAKPEECGPMRESGLSALKNRANSLRIMGKELLRKAAQLDALAKQIEAINAYARSVAHPGAEGPAPYIGIGSDADSALWSLAFAYDPEK